MRRRPKPPSSDPHATLGVSHDAPSAVIKASYHRLCLKYHPDRAGPDSHEKFVKIQEAYEYLYDNAVELEKQKQAGIWVCNSTGFTPINKPRPAENSGDPDGSNRGWTFYNEDRKREEADEEEEEYDDEDEDEYDDDDEDGEEGEGEEEEEEEDNEEDEDDYDDEEEYEDEEDDQQESSPETRPQPSHPEPDTMEAFLHRRRLREINRATVISTKMDNFAKRHEDLYGCMEGVNKEHEKHLHYVMRDLYELIQKKKQAANAGFQIIFNSRDSDYENNAEVLKAADSMLDLGPQVGRIERKLNSMEYMFQQFKTETPTTKAKMDLIELVLLRANH
ncbi:hypothetical protein F4806DRAFT_506879 [Annulohypoxylon nitens]|nr:hypothetical protein F4806DRAFT_506879 [Annulohypoxylon nitens]